METKRPTVLAAEELIDLYFPVLDHGFLALKDYMGSDEAIEEAARVSYQGGTRKLHQTRGLLRYLRRHMHCYAGHMEVLTLRGWVRWDECEATEWFLVPDPTTRTLKPESLPIEVFEADGEEMHCFENEHMSYCVTHDHRMWFKKKWQGRGGPEAERFEIVRSNEMSRWGHFDPSLGYHWCDADGEKNLMYCLLGFYLGDGCFASANRISFHLRKERKKQYLKGLLDELGVKYDTAASPTYNDATLFYVEPPEALRVMLGDRLQARANQKGFPLEQLQFLTPSCIRGLLEGLIQSDGHEVDDGEQIQFSSASPDLIHLFEALCAFVGFDAHSTKMMQEGVYRSTGYYGKSLTLEARKQFFSTRSHEGKVYCATTSTGLLVVRGGRDKFGFICGNTTPSEMVEMRFHVSMPIFVARQWIRHRMSSTNETSGRYSLLPMLFYTPVPQQFGKQSTANRQGREGQADQNLYDWATQKWNEQRATARALYEDLAEADVARELARIDLPLSTYTQWYWKIDLHNLFHFLALRCDAHAQWEIRQYANIMAGMVRALVPLSFEAWLDYQYMGAKLSRQEMRLIQEMLSQGKPMQYSELAEKFGNKREAGELLSKLNRDYDDPPDFTLDPSAAKTAAYFEEKMAKATPQLDASPKGLE